MKYSCNNLVSYKGLQKFRWKFKWAQVPGKMTVSIAKTKQKQNLHNQSMATTTTDGPPSATKLVIHESGSWFEATKRTAVCICNKLFRKLNFHEIDNSINFMFGKYNT